jgi:cyanate permease
MIMPSLSQRLIESFGWRLAYTIVAAPILLIAAPLIATFLKERPDEIGILRDGPARRPLAAERDDLGMSWREAWHSGTFWLVLCGYCFVGTGIHGCMIHLSAMLTDRGSSAQIAALASSLIGVGSMTGRLLSGYLLDRFFAPKVAACIFAGVAAAMAAFCISSGMGIAFPAAFLVGLGLGAEGDIVAYLISRYFGLRSFGEIYGYAFSGFVLTGALGPLLMGAGFDRTGSYVLPLVVFSAAASIAATLMTRLGPYQYVVLETGEGGMIST